MRGEPVVAERIEPEDGVYRTTSGDGEGEAANDISGDYEATNESYRAK